MAVEELLDLYNDIWSESDEPKTAAEFRAALAVDSITVSARGHFEFWFEDGGLFLGHVVNVRGTLEEGPTDADIAG